MTVIPHSEAIYAFYRIHNAPFPYNETIRNSRGSSVFVQANMVDLWVYFKHLAEKRSTRSFSIAREKWLEIAPYIPQRRINVDYRLLLDYFMQGKNYTPVNILTGRRLFQQEETVPKRTS